VRQWFAALHAVAVCAMLVLAREGAMRHRIVHLTAASAAAGELFEHERVRNLGSIVQAARERHQEFG
jgi:hypothetical protein